MEIILDHYKSPRNRADLSHLGDEALHENPSCGDSVKLELQQEEDGRIKSLLFDGHGCAISTASTSMMTELLTGKTMAEARDTIGLFVSVLRGELPREELEPYEDLAVFGGVVQFPMRVKCATLAWHALSKLLLSSSNQ